MSIAFPLSLLPIGAPRWTRTSNQRLMRHAALTIELEVQMVPPGGVEPPSPDLQSSALPLSYVGIWRKVRGSNPEHPKVRLFSRQLDVPALSNFPFIWARPDSQGPRYEVLRVTGNIRCFRPTTLPIGLRAQDWYPRRESNPQHLASKASASASWATWVW